VLVLNVGKAGNIAYFGKLFTAFPVMSKEDINISACIFESAG